MRRLPVPGRSRKRCAFLTLDDPAGYVIDDELACGPLRGLGWRVEAIPWRRPGVSWGRFDAVVIRSPWDYQKDPVAFLAVLWEIERSGTPLFNGLDLVRWNLPKKYLGELAERGVPTVPTVWLDRLGPGDLIGMFDAMGVDEIVVKPVVGANADGAFRLDRSAGSERTGELEGYYSRRALMAQPFVRAVVEEGEYSLVYVDGEYSHTVLKAPKAMDFRVQEEHGGEIRSVEVDRPLRAAGEAVIEALGERPLYARVDLVRSNDDEGFWLMELELIEPSLYLRMDPEAPERFARALDARVV
jgi:glutathione synthase/RimK-type ligase-like ATP-grasp enzyme